MKTGKKPIRSGRTIPVLCVILLLSMMSFRVKLFVEGEPSSIIVGPADSIQAAINNATAGSTILVSNGTYYESLQVNKSISLIGEGMGQTFIDGQNNQFIINITADNVNIEGFTIQSTYNPTCGIYMFASKGDTISYDMVEDSQQGISLSFCSNVTISDNTITANTQYGIYLTSCNNNTISDNTVTANLQSGLYLVVSNNNFFSGNMVSGNNGGLGLYTADNNVFSGNTFAGNYPTNETIQSYSYYNVFYDNNFNEGFYIDSTSSPNTWYNTATFEGNYWSNYSGTDLFSGRFQNETGSDGIGDTPYFILPRNTDHYPLMGQFHSYYATLAAETYLVSIISNSTVSGFEFEVGTETGNRVIQFNVSGAEGTVGFSRIAIPTSLMNTSVIVLVGGEEVVPNWLNVPSATLNYLYLTYTHSNQTILIIASKTLDLYNQLYTEYLALNETYYTLLSFNDTQLKMDLQNLNSTYFGQLNSLFNSYAGLLENYSQLQQTYLNLNASYQQHVLDYDQNLQNVRSIMYIFAAATAVLILATVYFSRHAFSRSTKAREEENPFSATRLSSDSRFEREKAK